MLTVWGVGFLHLELSVGLLLFSIIFACLYQIPNTFLLEGTSKQFAVFIYSESSATICPVKYTLSQDGIGCCSL